MSDEFDNFVDSQPETGGNHVAGLSHGAQAFIKQYMPTDDDSGCIASFETVSVFQPFKSMQATEKAGKTVELFEDVVFIRITIRGNDKIEVHRAARDEDKRRFPYAWQQFQSGNKITERGVPLKQLPGMEASIIRGYNAKNIWTIEDLAMVDDNNLQNIGTGAREFRRAAQEYIAKQKPSVDAEIKAQMDKQSEQLAKAMELLERLSAENAELRENQKGKPGRPRKDQEAA